MQQIAFARRAAIDQDNFTKTRLRKPVRTKHTGGRHADDQVGPVGQRLAMPLQVHKIRQHLVRTKRVPRLAHPHVRPVSKLDRTREHHSEIIIQLGQASWRGPGGHNPPPACLVSAGCINPNIMHPKRALASRNPLLTDRAISGRKRNWHFAKRILPDQLMAIPLRAGLRHDTIEIRINRLGMVIGRECFSALGVQSSDLRRQHVVLINIQREISKGISPRHIVNCPVVDCELGYIISRRLTVELVRVNVIHQLGQSTADRHARRNRHLLRASVGSASIHLNFQLPRAVAILKGTYDSLQLQPGSGHGSPQRIFHLDLQLPFESI